MHTSTSHPEIVSKEIISLLRFPHADVLTSDAARRVRQHSIERAARLGNGYQGKVDIYFQTAEGETKRVQTTVWASDAQHIMLKSGTALPMRSVLGVDFF